MGWTWPLATLVIRLALFAAFQALIALFFALQGTAAPWAASIAWWPLSVTLTGVANLLLLIWLFGREGLRYRDLLRFNRPTWKSDLRVLLGFSLLAGPIGYLPSVLGSQWLFGDAMGGPNLMFLPLPMWMAVASLIFLPVAIAISELPNYFAYAMPRLQVLSRRNWLGLTLAVIFLAAQHCAMPLIFDGPFLLWRFVSFLPFALLVGLVLNWRPRLLPYLMIVHWLIDIATAFSIFAVS